MPEQPVTIQLTALNQGGVRVNAYPKTRPQDIENFSAAISAAMPIATTENAGLVQVGGNINVTSGGVISVPVADYLVESAEGSYGWGVVTVDLDSDDTNGLVVSNGVLSVKPATTYQYGAVKLAEYNGAEDSWYGGSVPDYTALEAYVRYAVRRGDDMVNYVPYYTASTSEYGVVKIGANINVTSGVVSVDTASTSVRGVVQIASDGGIDINAAGRISVPVVSAGLQAGRVLVMGESLVGPGYRREEPQPEASGLEQVAYYSYTGEYATNEALLVSGRGTNGHIYIGNPVAGAGRNFYDPLTGDTLALAYDKEPEPGDPVYADEMEEEIIAGTVTAYTDDAHGLILPVGATKWRFGMVQIGDNITVNAGTISIPEATGATLGVTMLIPGPIDPASPSTLGSPSVNAMVTYVEDAFALHTTSAMTGSTSSSLLPTCGAVRQYVASKIPDVPEYEGARLTTLTGGTVTWMRGDCVQPVQWGEAAPGAMVTIEPADRTLYAFTNQLPCSSSETVTNTIVIDMSNDMSYTDYELDFGIRLRTGASPCKVSILYLVPGGGAEVPTRAEWADSDIPPHYAANNPEPEFDRLNTTYMVRLHWDAVDQKLLANQAYTKE